MTPIKKEDGPVYYKLKGDNTWTTAFDPFTVGRKLRYEMVTDSTIRIVGIYSTIELTEVVIPEELNGYRVVDIAPSAFSLFYNLERIMLPSSLAGLKDTLELPSSNPEVIIEGEVGLNYTSYTLYLRTSDSVQLEVLGTSEIPVWSSSDSSIAFVFDDGTVYGYHPGVATITAKVGAKEFNCEIEVNPVTYRALIVANTYVNTSNKVFIWPCL